jgi:serine/threonine protein kinase
LDNIDTEKEFGIYQPLSQLASNGYNRIHLAQSTLPPWQTVVIKIYMKRRLRLQPHNEREAFLKSAQLLCQLKHPHLVSVIDVGFRDGWPYVIMDHATGGSLRQRLHRQTPEVLPTEEILTVIEQTSQVLDYLHQEHLIHGNIKPENILFTEHNQVLLSDLDPMTFSGASSSADLGLHYTSPYAAPEQIADQKSSQSDQYALGCIAYELFTGRAPFSSSGPSLQPNLSTKTTVSPTQINPSLSQPIEQAILKAMAKDINNRYESILQFNQALRVAAGLSIGSSLTATEIPTPEQSSAPSPIFWESLALSGEDSDHDEQHEESPVARYTKLAPSMTQSQTRQKRGARTKTAVQIWLLVACLATALGATSEILHLFSWPSTPSQQSIIIAMHPVRQIVSSPQSTSSSPGVHTSATITSTPTATPTPLPTPTIAPPPTQLPLGLATEYPTVADPGFEIPSLGQGGYQYNPVGSDWTFGNGAGIAANGSAFTNNNPNAPQGTQVAFLQGTGSFSQTISFRAGSYQISFYAAQRKKNNQNFQVLIDGHVVSTFTPSGPKYKPHNTSRFTVSTGNHVLSFQGLNSNGGDNTAFIDVVAIQ